MNTITREITGARKSKVTTHLSLNKKVALDIARMQKLSSITICEDASNYCNRVAYPLVSTCAQCFRSELSYQITLFRAI